MALTIAQLKNLVDTNLADNSNIIPSEHRAVELALIDYIETLQPISTSNIPVNRGYVTATTEAGGTTEAGINLGTTLSDKLKCYGNISSSTILSTGNYSMLTVTLQNAMPSTNYIVKHYLEHIPTASEQPLADVLHPVFKILSTTQFQIVCREANDQTQKLRFHLETVGY